MNGIKRRTILRGGLGIGAATLCPSFAAFAHEDEAPLGDWSPLAPMPFPVQEIYPAPFWRSSSEAPSLKPKPFNIIVNAGGLTPSAPNQVTDKVTFYDPHYDAWGFGHRLPAPRHHLALVNNNGLLYGIGGFARDDRGGWQMRADAWRTRSIEEPWRAISPLPHPQAEFVCASLAGFIHVAGGRSPIGSRNEEWEDHIDTDEHWYYDTASDRWYGLAPLPTPRNSAAGVSINGVLYVIGGRTVRGGNLNTVEIYDPLSDRWSSGKPMPKSQGGLAAAVVKGKIYVFGGEYFSPAPGGVFAEAWEYDPKKDDWRAIAAMPRKRHGLGAVTIDDTIYVLGGASGVGGDGTSEALDQFQI